MNQQVKLVMLVLSIFFLINTASALTYCNYGAVSLNNTDSQKTVTCSNGGNTTVYLSSSIPYISIFPTFINPGDNPQITITMLETTPAGTYNGNIIFSDGTPSITISAIKTVQQSSPSVGCNIDIFPTILTNIKIKQGEIKTRNIQLTIPSCYASPINVQGVALQTDEQPIQLGELSLGTIQPGNSVLIPIEINAVGVATGQYSDTLQLLLYNSSGIKIDVTLVSVSVLVTAGIQPISNFSLSDLPQCTVNAVDLNLNSTYKLTCTQTPNIQIRPIVDKKYIIGISKEQTGTTYTYTFKPMSIGTTTIQAEFLSDFAPLGSPYEQELRITSGGIPLPGTTIDLNFYQGDIKREANQLQPGQTNIIIRDSNTQSIIGTYTIYLNGQLANSTFNLNDNKFYELIVDAQGYLTKTINFTVSNFPAIIIILAPESNFQENTPIYVNTTPDNSSLFLDGQKLEIKTILTTPGLHTIEAISEGYKNTLLNITVEELTKILSPESLKDTIKKGEEQIIILSKNSTWQVLYGKDLAQFNVLYSEISDRIIFTPQDSGYYRLSIDGRIADTIDLTGGWFHWWYIPILIVIVAIIIVVIVRRTSSNFSSNFTDLGNSIVQGTPPM